MKVQRMCSAKWKWKFGIKRQTKPYQTMHTRDGPQTLGISGLLQSRAVNEATD